MNLRKKITVAAVIALVGFTDAFAQGYTSQDFFNVSLQAASRSNVSAQFNLGWCYFHGIGTRKNLNQAEALFKKAAAKGDSSSMFYLGLYYEGKKGL